MDQQYLLSHCVMHWYKHFTLNPHNCEVSSIISDVSDEETYTEITDLPVIS